MVDIKKGADVPALHSLELDIFGRRSSSRTSRGSMKISERGSGTNGTLTPVFKCIYASEKEKDPKHSSPIPDHHKSGNVSKQSAQSNRSSNSSYGNPLADLSI